MQLKEKILKPSSFMKCNQDQSEKGRKVESIALASREFAYQGFQEIDSSILSIRPMDTSDGLLNLKCV